MKKAFLIIGILGVMTIVYLFLTVVMPFITGLASTANTTISSSSNMSNYPGLSGGLVSTPLVMYFIPAGIAMVMIILVLRAKG